MKEKYRMHVKTMAGSSVALCKKMTGLWGKLEVLLAWKFDLSSGRLRALQEKH